MLKTTIYFLLIIALNSSSLASEFTFRHLTMRDGLPSNRIKAIIKGSDGFMWFASGDCIARFDGYMIKNFCFEFDSTASPLRDEINCMLDDGNGNLWIGCSEQGLIKFDKKTGSFTRLISDPALQKGNGNNRVNALLIDIDGIFWIATNNGLSKYDDETDIFTHHSIPDEVSGGFKNPVLSLFQDKSGRFWVGTANGLYGFNKGNGVFSFFNLSPEFPMGRYRNIRCLTEDTEGNLWIGTNWGLFKYVENSKEIQHFLPLESTGLGSDMSYPSTHISNMFIGSIAGPVSNGKEILWIATDYGLNRLSLETLAFESIYSNSTDPGGLSTTFLNELFLDDIGLLWIGTENSGVEILNTRRNPFHHQSMGDGDFFYQATCFLEDSDKDLWVGGIDGGLFHYDPNLNLIGNYKEWQFDMYNIDNRYSNRINSIYEFSIGKLWLGFFEWGLVEFDKKLKTFSQIPLNSGSDSKEHWYIPQILEDEYGFIWIGTNAGLFFKKKQDGSPVRIVDHIVLDHAEIVCIYEDGQKNLWVCTLNEGMFLLKEVNKHILKFESIDSLINADFLPITNISCFHEDLKGILWLGTDKGIYFLDQESGMLQPDSVFNKSNNGMIFRIFGDDNNNLWIYHATKGLIRYMPYGNEPNNIRIFDLRDGLPFNNFNDGFSPSNSFYQAGDGRLYLSANVGIGSSFLWFYPENVLDNQKTPEIVITSFKVGHEDFILDTCIHAKHHIKLRHNENFFSFGFSALDFLIPEKNQYAYYMEGLEDGWIYSGNQRLANYTGVPTGHYIFKVKASNNDGYWNNTYASIDITIMPPYWKTWWAYLVYALAFLLITFSVVYYYLRRQQLLHTLDLEQAEATKLKELDRMKSTFFENISHEFRTPLTLIIGYVERLFNKPQLKENEEDLSMVLRNAGRLESLINQLLSLSKLEAGKMKLKVRLLNIVPLIRSYIQSFESLLDQQSISLTFTSDKERIDIFIDEEKILQVMNNLLSNAIKFTSKGGHIDVDIFMEYKPATAFLANQDQKQFDGKMHFIAIRVADSGCGIPSDKIEHIFERFYQVDDTRSRHYEGTGIGLSVVRELMNMHHGKVIVESKEGIGSTFIVLIPKGKDHFNPGELPGNQVKGKTDPYENIHINTDYKVNMVNPGTAFSEEDTRPIMLIVEDNQDMRKYVGGFFNEVYNIIEAANGMEGLEKAIDHVPDVIISDVMMPGMDGIEFSQKIRLHENTSHIPLIMLTARASKESRLMGLKTGADDFITKPFDGDELKARVRNLINQRKKLNEHYRRKFDSPLQADTVHELSMDEKFLLRARNAVEENLANAEYGVEALASDMALSRYQLHRKLSALLGQSTTEFIRRIRLNTAIIMLKNKTATISEIAYDTGFNNPNYFSISFKKQFGVSPTEYLRLSDQSNTS